MMDAETGEEGSGERIRHVCWEKKTGENDEKETPANEELCFR